MTKPGPKPREDITHRHPLFDEYWLKYKGLVFWLSKRVAKAFGGRALDYVGTYTLRFNKVLHYFDTEKGQFTTLFMCHCYDDAVEGFLRYESEKRALYYAARNSTSQAVKQAEIEYAYHEAHNILYSIPEEDNDYIVDIIASFQTVQECWEFFTRHLEKRDKFIIEQRIREDRTLQQIGDDLKISKERTRQIYERALNRIRDRLLLVQRFTDLFQKKMDED